MVDARFAKVGSTSTRLIEEMAELILAITKAQRFGLDNWHPDDPKKETNRSRIRQEMQDVRRLLLEYEEFVLPRYEGDLYGATDAEDEPGDT